MLCLALFDIFITKSMYLSMVKDEMFQLRYTNRSLPRHPNLYSLISPKYLFTCILFKWRINLQKINVIAAFPSFLFSIPPILISHLQNGVQSAMVGYYARGKLALSMLMFYLINPVHSAAASDMFQADSYFQQEQYSLARELYVDAAIVGSAHAFYQLGLMEYKGLGTSQNISKALVWFNLAAEQHFNDSAAIVDDLMALVPDENKTAMSQLINSFLNQYGMQHTSQKYYPQIKTTELASQILYVEEDQSPEDASPSYRYIDTLDIDLLRESEWDAEKMMSGGSLGPSDIFARAKPRSIRQRAYSAIVDYDVGPDGSPRYLESSQEISYFRPAFYQLTLSRGPSPQFAGNKVAFVNRAKLGLAGYNKFKLSNATYEQFYYALIRKAKKLRKIQSPVEQYTYGLLLMTFEWLAHSETEIDDVFTHLSESGFPLAQYEYGAMLYREQKDIPQAIHWLSEASKYGSAKAQYRLAHILMHSPWVEKDEDKALFWLEKAAESGHKVARLKTAELKILAIDTRLHNLQAAQEDLSKVDKSLNDTPEYEYLHAMLNYSFTPRKLPSAVEHLRKAIRLGEHLNWDTTDWQDALNSWTSGGTVTIVEK